MRILLDACVWKGSADILRAEGFDVTSVAEWPADPGDEELLRIAYQQARVLITLDKDFGELAVVQGMPHSGIIRLVGFPARQQGMVALQMLRRYEGELARHALITVSASRVRVRLDLLEE